MLKIFYGDSIFDANEKATVYKVIKENDEPILYGVIYKDGTVKLHRPIKSNRQIIHINDRNMARIGFIYLYGNDNRIDYLWDYIHEFQGRVIDYEKRVSYDKVDRWIEIRKQDRL